jgi:phytoene dehydrogenase-like protein
MTEKYDGIIIGSGQHGLVLGSYLAKAGLKILILERRLMYGGGLGTQEVTKPGFYHQMHSVNHFNIENTPWFKDLGLSARMRYVTPRYDFAQPHREGPPLVFSHDIDETVDTIAKFNKRDAQTYREWNARADSISDHIFWPERYSEPIPEVERDELLSRSAVGRDFLEIIDRQPLNAVDELFENEQLKLLLLFKISLFGTVLYDQISTRSPMGALLRGFDLKTNYQIAIGGSFSLARSLMETFIAAGGELRLGSHVERIVVDDNKASGVQLADGTVIRANFVASTVDVPQTFSTMVGAEQLPDAYAEKVRNFKQTEWALFGLHLALEEHPRHIGTELDPRVNQSLKVNIGCESIEQLFALHDEVAQNKIPSKISFGTGAVSQFDPSQAPAGKATAYAWHAMPYAPDGDPENIEAVKEEFAERMIDTWEEWAPNINRKNIIGKHVYTANDYTKELINMVNGDIFVASFTGEQTMWNHLGYRTPIEGLYMAGSTVHPGGAISGGGGYIASRIICEDLGVPLWWTPVDARASLERLAQRG